VTTTGSAMSLLYGMKSILFSGRRSTPRTLDTTRTHNSELPPPIHPRIKHRRIKRTNPHHHIRLAATKAHQILPAHITPDQITCSVGRMTTSFTSMWGGALRHHTTARATSAGLRHLMARVTASAAAVSPKARTVKNSVSTSPGLMPETRRGTPAARACWWFGGFARGGAGGSGGRSRLLGVSSRLVWRLLLRARLPGSCLRSAAEHSSPPSHQTLPKKNTPNPQTRPARAPPGAAHQ